MDTMKRQQGFTIIEIVVSLVVVGILMGAIINQLISFRRSAYQTGANNIVQGIQSAVTFKSSALMVAFSANPAAHCMSGDGVMPAMCMEAYRGALWAVFHAPSETIALCNGSDDTTSTGGEGEASFRYPPVYVRGTGEFIPGNIGAGWNIQNSVDVMVFTPDFDGSVRLQAPDGNIYTSEIKLQSFREYCQTPY